MLDMTPVLVVGSLCTLTGWIVWVVSTNVRRRQATEKLAALHSKLLDRCANSDELMRYLESDAGRRFLEYTAIESSNPTGRIISAIQAGFIFSLLGVAGLIVRQAIEFDGRQVLLVLGSGALAIGVGFLISALASYLLSKSWGLLRPGSAKFS